MTHSFKPLSAAAAALALVAMPLASHAAPATATVKDDHQCFQTSQWHGWSAPSDNEVLLRVSGNQIFRVEVTGGAERLKDPGAFIVSDNHTGTICSHLDLDLQVATSGGFRSGLIATSLTKLSPDQIAQIPKNQQP